MEHTSLNNNKKIQNPPLPQGNRQLQHQESSPLHETCESGDVNKHARHHNPSIDPDSTDVESQTSASSGPAMAQESIAVPLRRLTMPGAVAMRGCGYNQRDSRSSIDDEEYDEMNADVNSPVIVSAGTNHENRSVPVIIPADEVQTLEVRRSSSHIVAQVRQALLQDTLQAEVLKVNTSSTSKTEEDAENATRIWWKRCLGSSLLVILLGVIVVVVVVLLTVGRDRSSSHATSANNITNATQPPTLSPTPGTRHYNPSCTYCLQNVTDDFPENSSTRNITELLAAASNHTILTELLSRTGVDGHAGNFTLFAPTDDAFDALEVPYKFYVSFPTFSWIYHLVFLLNSHIVTEPLNSTQIFLLEELPTASGSNLIVNSSDMTIADYAKVAVADVQASNGYIQVPDRVLLTNELRRNLRDVITTFLNGADLSIFAKIVAIAKVENILLQYMVNGLTIFVPTNSAFEALGSQFIDDMTLPGHESKTREIVLYHMVPVNLYQDLIFQFKETYDDKELGELSCNHLSVWFTANTSTVFVNTAPIQQGAIYTQNGLINVIDQVLIPPTVEDLLEQTTQLTSYSFETFLSIVHGPANMTSLFSSNRTLTVFAPLEIAFESSPNPLKRWLDSVWLLHLQSIVLYHCVAKEIRNSELIAGNYTFSTLSGFETTVQVPSDSNSSTSELTWSSLLAGQYFDLPNITINNGPGVMLKNLFAVNGIVYGIDGVLLPPWTDFDVNATLAQKQDFGTFVSLAALTNLTSFLVGSGPFTLLAPNNTAFAVHGDIFSTTPGNVTLIRDILSRHIFAGNLYSSQLQNNAVLVSINNETFPVQRMNNLTYVGDALIVESDVLCSNGVIHVIDHLLRI